MTPDHLREIALIQISQSQRTISMTAAHYANGALRLSHDKGTHVLTRMSDGQAIEISGEDLPDVQRILDGKFEDQTDVDAVFQHIDHWRSRSARDAWLRKV